MIVQVHIYSRGPTGHIAWQFGGAYVSFNKGKRIADAGSVQLPLPTGTVPGRALVSHPEFRSEADDVAKYTDANHRRVSITVTGCDEDLAGRFAVDLIKAQLPYVLWDPHRIGSINCVTTSLMIFAIMMPPGPWPADWDAKWGSVFTQIATLRREATEADWVGRITREPFTELMYVDQFREMIEDWQREQPGG